MGIKMSRARYNGQDIKIDEYDTIKMHGKLTCYYCNAGVTFVNSYERNLGERKILVPKFFRLQRGEEHGEGVNIQLMEQYQIYMQLVRTRN